MKLSTLILLAVCQICIGLVVDTLNDKTNVEFISQAGENDPPAELSHIQLFELSNTDLEIVFKWTSRDDMKEDIYHLLDLVNGPEVIGWYAGGEVSRSLIKQGKLENLHDIYTQYNLYEKFPGSLLKGISDENDHPYMVPTDYYHWGVYYRKSVFTEMGLSPPSTWNEFLDVCEAFKQKGTTPIVVGSKNMWPLAGWFDYLNMRINSPEFHINVTAGNIEYDHPKIKEVFNTWKMLIDRGYFSSFQESSSNPWTYAQELLINKTAGMTLMGDFIRTSVQNEAIREDFDFFQFPIIDPTVLIGEDAPTDGYLLPSNSKNKEGAARLLAYFASDEYQSRRLNYTSIPSNLESAQSISDAGVVKGAAMIENSDFVVQFYDRDTTPAMAAKGMQAMYSFTESPEKIDSILHELEVYRKEFYLGIAATPEILPPAGEYPGEIQVTITSRSDGTIYYSLDGSLPTEDSLVYNNTFTLAVDGRNVVRAIVIAEGFRSDVAQISYYLDIAELQTIGRSGAIAGLILSSIGIAINLIVMVLIQVQKSAPVVRASSPPFVQTIVFGCIITLSTGIFMSLDPVIGIAETTVGTLCSVQIWTMSIGWSLAFGSLLAKTWRVMKIFENKSLKNITITNARLATIVVVLVIIEIGICTAWMIISPPMWARSDLGSNQYAYMCTGAQSTVLMTISLMPKLILLFAAIFVSYKTRNYVSAFNESKRIAFAVYNLAFIGGASLALGAFMQEIAISHIVRVVGLFITVECIVISIAVMPLVIVYVFPDQNTSKSWFSNHDTPDVSNTTVEVNQATIPKVESPSFSGI